MNCTIRVAKTKVLISFEVTAKLICAFVFVYADCWFSHAEAQFCWFSHAEAQFSVFAYADCWFSHAEAQLTEPTNKKTNDLHMQKRRCRSAVH